MTNYITAYNIYIGPASYYPQYDSSTPTYSLGRKCDSHSLISCSIKSSCTPGPGSYGVNDDYVYNSPSFVNRASKRDRNTYGFGSTARPSIASTIRHTTTSDLGIYYYSLCYERILYLKHS